MVLPYSRRIPRVLRYSGSPRRQLIFAYETVTPSGRPFQTVQLIIWLSSRVLYPMRIATHGLGSFPFARRYSENRLLSFFSSGYLDVSVPRVPLHTLWIHVCIPYSYGEFPHSDICGSRLICSSPQLFAACHVLLRRLVPRHPPYALLRLITPKLLS